MILPVNIHTHRPRPGETTLPAEGIHPWEAAGDWTLREPSAACRAIGEIGLDYACPVDRGRQELLLRAQLQQAERLGLPVVLHCVRAFEPLMKILDGRRLRAVIFHGFIGSAFQAGAALKRGYFLSFGERSLRSPRTVEVLRGMPGEFLFLETDDSPTPIGEIYRRAAVVRGCTEEELLRTVQENYERIFRL